MSEQDDGDALIPAAEIGVVTQFALKLEQLPGLVVRRMIVIGDEDLVAGLEVNAFHDDIAALASKPIVQRLRHVRLSNIDSIDLPGIVADLD